MKGIFYFLKDKVWNHVLIDLKAQDTQKKVRLMVNKITFSIIRVTMAIIKGLNKDI